MSQLIKTCSLVNGSQTVTVLGINLISRILQNCIFMLAGELVPYTVAQNSTFNGTNTIVVLTGAYQGATNASASGVFVTDYTYPNMIPVIAQGDIGTAAIFSDAMYKVQRLITVASPGGLVDYQNIATAVDGKAATVAANKLLVDAALVSVSASAASATTAASTATTSQASALASKTSATASAVAAAADRATAVTNATNAATAAATAVSAATTATVASNELIVALAEFRAVFVGSYASDPTLDGNGHALIDGAEYFNTTTNTLMVRDAGVWEPRNADMNLATNNAMASAANAAGSASSASASAASALSSKNAAAVSESVAASAITTSTTNATNAAASAADAAASLASMNFNAVAATDLINSAAALSSSIVTNTAAAAASAVSAHGFSDLAEVSKVAAAVSATTAATNATTSTSAVTTTSANLTASNSSKDAAAASATSAAASAASATSSATSATSSAVAAAASAVTASGFSSGVTASAAAAAASAVAADTSAAAALQSKTDVATLATAIITSTNSASDSAAAAVSAAASAQTSKNSATDSATSASASAALALAQAVVATTQANLAITQVGIATTQATGAASSATAAGISAGIASSESNFATTQAATASSSASTAVTSASSATASSVTATSQAQIATAQAVIATAQTVIATTKAAEAVVSASSATTSELLAAKWADETQNIQVETGRYSAKHWALQAQASSTGSVVYRGLWSAAGGTYPLAPGLGNYYVISVAGTISSISYIAGDSIIFNGTTWDKAGGTTISSVNGQTGTVVVTKADVGLGNATNTSDADKPVSTAQATAIALKANISSLATVAISGSYSDLSDKPTAYSLPVATGLVLGGVKSSSSVLIDAAGIATATPASVGARPSSYVPAWSEITSKPTTLAGFGISDAQAALGFTPYNATNPSGFIAAAGAPVQSVGGLTGAVTKLQLGISNVDNTADTGKPVSTAQALADTAIGSAAASDATTKANAAQAAAIAASAPVAHVGSSGASHADATITTSGFLSSTDKTKLNGIAAGATAYSHPANHDPAVITQDASNRFVTDAEKATWNGKQASLGFTAENIAKKDATGGYAGLTLFKLNLRNSANSFTSYFATEASASRTWTMPDATGTVALVGDISVLSSTAPAALGASAVGVGTTAARADHVHQAQTTVSGAAGSANALNTANNYQVTKLGIGAAPVATWAGPSLDIGAVGSLYTHASTVLYAGNNTYYDTGWKAKTTAAAGLYALGAGTHTWYSMASVSANAAQTPVQTMALDASGNLVSTLNVTGYSDERLKTNWKALPVDFVKNLSSVKCGTYDRIDVRQSQVGVSAQSLMRVLPNAVLEQENGLLSVAYGNAALAACVMLAREVEELKNRIEQLEKM